MTKRYRVEVQYRGLRLRKWVKSREEIPAVREALRSELKKMTGEAEASSPSKTVSEVLDEASGYLWRSSPHRDRHLGKVRQALKPVLDLPIANLGPRDLDTCVDRLLAAGAKGVTVDKSMSYVSTFLRWAAERGYCDPIRVPKTGERPNTRVRYLTVEEEETLVSLLRSWGQHEMADLVTAAVETGCRKSELLSAQPGQVRRGYLHLWRTKNGKARAVPLTPLAKAILKRRLPWNLSEASVRYWWDKARAEMGLADDPLFVFHALRHTCATRLAIGGVDVLKIKEWLGHKSLASTLIYVNMAPEHLTAGLAALEGFRK